MSEVEEYGSKKYYDQMIKHMLAQSKYIPPICKAVRVLLFSFTATTQAFSLNKLTVPFDVIRVKASIVAITAAASGTDIHAFQCSLNNNNEIASAVHGTSVIPSVGQPLEFLYQQPRSFVNEEVMMQSMGFSNNIYAPVALTMFLSLQLELSNI